jgi:hypothetical protein
MERQKNYWFKAKANGLGWSIPLTWQGWIVYSLMFASVFYFLFFKENIGEKILGMWVSIGLCIPICWLFGEPLTSRKL